MSDALKEKTISWCTDEGIFKEKIADKKASFHFIINFPKGSPYNMEVVQPKGRDDLIVIVWGIGVGEEHLEKIKSLKEKDKELFLWEMRYLLGGRLTEVALHHPDNILQKFVISSPLYADGLNKNIFMSTLGEIFKSGLLGIWKIQEKFGVPKKPTLSTTTPPVELYR